MTTISTSTQNNLRITLAVTETITTTYRLTEEELRALNLPTTVAELEALDTDDLGANLLDNAEDDEYAVTEREIEITTNANSAAETSAGK